MFGSYFFSILLHLALALLIFLWPSSPPVRLDQPMMQISVNMGAPGGNRMASPVLGPQGKPMPTKAAPQPAPAEQAASAVPVAREDTVSFLEEKLAILGLNERESADFITYWLPILSQSDYNRITFPCADDARLVPLQCQPQPDTLIRVYMLSEGLDEAVMMELQTLMPAPIRTGLTVVEWGGSRRNS